jgi:hypothetical protein
MKLFLLALMSLALRAEAPRPQEVLASAWHSPQARQDLGFILYSYYESKLPSPQKPAEEDDAGSFSDDLESFLAGQGRENDCALVHALWFDMGEGAEGEIIDEIASRGEHMLPIIAYALQELALRGGDGSGDECGLLLSLDQGTIRDIYQDCVKEIRAELRRQST